MELNINGIKIQVDRCGMCPMINRDYDVFHTCQLYEKISNDYKMIASLSTIHESCPILTNTNTNKDERPEKQ
jgi:hypothetical protein